jgi:hypothetical protein
MKISRPPRPSQDAEIAGQSSPVSFYVTQIMLFSTIFRLPLLKEAQPKKDL